MPGANPAGPIVVMTHGWGSSRIGGLKRLGAVLPHARDAVLWDLPGHGETPGRVRLGADEHLDLLRLLDSIGPAPIVLFGWSLGAGVSLRAAAEDACAHDIRAVICEAPYIRPITPAQRVIALRGLPHRVNLPLALGCIGVRSGIGWSWHGFDRDRHAGALGSVPLTVIHGDQDPICPISDGARIADAAPDGRLVTIQGGGHNNLWTDPRFKDHSARAVGDALRRVTIP